MKFIRNNNANNVAIEQQYPSGTFVEYRSRTMANRWILAKVENFDEKNRYNTKKNYIIVYWSTLRNGASIAGVVNM